MTTTKDTAPVEQVHTCETFQRATEMVGQRWVAAILVAGVRGARRFGEYRATVTGISDKVLAQRLKELEALGLIERTVIPSMPVQIRYAPSPDARELIALLTPVVAWANTWFGAAARTTTHSPRSR